MKPAAGLKIIPIEKGKLASNELIQISRERFPDCCLYLLIEKHDMSFDYGLLSVALWLWKMR